MNSKTTWRLFLAAIALFAFIVFVENRSPGKNGATPMARVFPQMDPRTVSLVEVRVSNTVVRAERTNESWRLISPFYPAQSTPIDTFVQTLAQLPKLEVIGASEVSARAGKLKDFGLDPPLAILTINQGSDRHHLHLGSRTPMFDQLYVMAPGSGEVLVTDLSILKVMPASADQWRSTMLLQLAGRPFDRMQIRSRQRLLEFQRDPTNILWRISKPTPARANTERITQLLQKLNTSQVKRFVTDSPVADLERFGLQPPELELSFSLDTNRVAALEFGASPTNDAASVFVRRPSTTNVVLAARELFEELSQPSKAFHDPRLLSLDPAQLTSIQVKGSNSFTVVLQTNGLWGITEPSSMVADPELMRAFLKNLLDLEIVDFAKDVPTDADIKQFGFAPPRFAVALFATLTNAAGAASNTLITQLDFGVNKSDDTVYARRSDETPIYVTPNEYWLLPRGAWQLRDRRVFDFAATNVTRLAVAWRGQTNRLERQAQGWIPDDLVKNAQVDELLFRIGQLRARNWTDKGAQRLGTFGFSNNGLSIEAAVRREGALESAILLFGKRGLRNNVYAATVLPGDNEPTVFEFPGELFEQLRLLFDLPPP